MSMHRQPVLTAVLLGVLFFIDLADAQQDTTSAILPDSTSRTADKKAILVGKVTAFELLAGTEDLSLGERASIIQQRVSHLSKEGILHIQARPSLMDSARWELRAGDNLIAVVSERDARLAGQTVGRLAAAWSISLQQALRNQQRPRTLQDVTGKVVIGLLFPVFLWIVFLIIGRISRWMDTRVLAIQERGLQDIRIAGFEVMHSALLGALILAVSRLVKIVLYLTVGYATVILFFSLFPQTRPVGTWMIRWIVDPAVAFGQALLSYAPAVIAAVVVAILVRFLLRFIDFVIDQMDQGLTPILATSHRLLFALRHLVRPVVFILAAIFVLSYMPGINTKILDNVTVGLIVLVVIGLWRPCENLLADVVLSYTRPFRYGDRLTFGAFSGTVYHQGPFFVYLRDDQGMERVIPNRLFLHSDFGVGPRGAKGESTAAYQSPEDADSPI